METRKIPSSHGITLVGGAPVSPHLLTKALALAPDVVAADGGADQLLALGHKPLKVIGDLDSISPAARQLLADRLWQIDEQVTTDFDKALRHLAAPYVLALGFLGGRLDHSLAALNSLARQGDQPCVLLSDEDVTFHCPPDLTLELPIGTRVSLFPMRSLTAKAEGLLWPLQGLTLSPLGRIGTSNETSAPLMHLHYEGGGLLVILPLDHLPAVLNSIARA